MAFKSAHSYTVLSLFKSVFLLGLIFLPQVFAGWAGPKGAPDETCWYCEYDARNYRPEDSTWQDWLCHDTGMAEGYFPPGGDRCHSIGSDTTTPDHSVKPAGFTTKCRYSCIDANPGAAGYTCGDVLTDIDPKTGVATDKRTWPTLMHTNKNAMRSAPCSTWQI